MSYTDALCRLWGNGLFGPLAGNLVSHTMK